MRVVSVNVGGPREVEWHGHIVETSIWKLPVEGRVHAAGINLAGDLQSDRTVHGGASKAVYVYPSEHYEFWRGELPEMNLPWGAFGENLTTEGLLENEVLIGDVMRIGSAEFGVTQPRMPCFKLGIRFGDDRMVRRFWLSRRSGFYFTILREGDVGAGDEIEIVRRGPGLSIADVFDNRSHG